MISRFHVLEDTRAHARLQAWRRANPSGYLFNLTSPDSGMLHRGECAHLGDLTWKANDSDGDLTRQLKVCSVSLEEINGWTTSAGLTSIRVCKDCNPESDAPAPTPTSAKPSPRQRPSRHFVQYHSPERMGPYEFDGSFGIVTNKSVDKLVGDRVWLITSTPGRPRQYFLCETFVVDRVETNRPELNRALGSTGKSFEPMIRIDTARWFKTFLGSMANFSIGLSPISSETAALFLGLTSLSDSGPPVAEPTPDQRTTGSGFGSPESNRELELAAIQAVRAKYGSAGWTVASVERENLGYDLDCRRGDEVEHIEVKGIRGDTCSFVITANELDTARVDPSFRLCAVLRAMDDGARRICPYTWAELDQAFTFAPVSYFARPKR